MQNKRVVHGVADFVAWLSATYPGWQVSLTRHRGRSAGVSAITEVGYKIGFTLTPHLRGPGLFSISPVAVIFNNGGVGERTVWLADALAKAATVALDGDGDIIIDCDIEDLSTSCLRTMIDQFVADIKMITEDQAIIPVTWD